MSIYLSDPNNSVINQYFFHILGSQRKIHIIFQSVVMQVEDQTDRPLAIA